MPSLMAAAGAGWLAVTSAVLARVSNSAGDVPVGARARTLACGWTWLRPRIFASLREPCGPTWRSDDQLLPERSLRSPRSNVLGVKPAFWRPPGPELEPVPKPPRPQPGTSIAF